MEISATAPFKTQNLATWQFHPSIRPFSILLTLCRITGILKHIPGNLQQKTGYTLDEVATHCNAKWQSTWTACLWTVEGKQSTSKYRKNTQTPGQKFEPPALEV